MAQEIERKYLVLDDSYKHEAFTSSRIQQGYICSERGRTVRIRIRDEHAYLTIKGPSLNGGLSRYEFPYQFLRLRATDSGSSRGEPTDRNR